VIVRESVAARLRDLREQAVQQAPVDSPLFSLLKEWQPGDIARLKTDVFREQVQLNEELKRRLVVVTGSPISSSTAA